MKKTFTIPVTRIGYSYKNIEVEANSQEEAETIALDEAGDEVFSERESDYVLPDSDSGNVVVKLLMGEDANHPFQHISQADSKEEVIEKLTEEYGEDEVKSCISEMAMGIQTHTFETQKEADAFIKGINVATGFLEGAVFSQEGHALAKIIETLDEENQ